MKKILITLAAGVIVLAAGAFGWWTLSPLFIDKVVEEELAPEIVTLIETDKSMTTGPFGIEDTPGHPASGSITVIENGEQSLVRYEKYDGTNGPDLFVYLAKDLDANEYVSLGRAKGNQGNINYEVPEDIDLSEYKYVMTWCKAFGVLFDYAEIN